MASQTDTAQGQNSQWKRCHLGSAGSQFEVYQLAHADILITELPRKSNRASSSSNDVQGSAKTIAALTKDRKPAASQDPWDEHDPWSTYQPPAKASRVGAGADYRRDDIDAIAIKVQQKLEAKQSNVKQAQMDDDQSMQTDDRVGQLEMRINQIESTMQDQHRQQTQITAELSGQIASVQHQTQAIHSHIDQKMQEQLANIERLLSKRRAE